MADIKGISSMLGDSNPLTQNTNKEQASQTTSVWLPAPYNVIVKPLQSTTNKTQTSTGQNYQSAMEQFNQLKQEAQEAQLEYTTPKFRLDTNTGKVIISGAPEKIESPEFKQISKSISDSFKGIDLSDKDMATAFQATIAKANEQLLNNSRNELYKDFLERAGFSDDAYSNYRYTMQSKEDTNLLKSKNIIKGLDKSGKPVSKSIQEWFEYWKKEYSAEERAKLWLDSQKSLYKAMVSGGDDALYAATPFLLMGEKETVNAVQGILNQINPFDKGLTFSDAKTVVPVYGFDTSEDLEAFGKTFGGEWQKAGLGIAQSAIETPYGYLGGKTGKGVFGDKFDEDKHLPDMSEEDFNKYLEMWRSSRKLTDKSRVKELTDKFGEDEAMRARVAGEFAAYHPYGANAVKQAEWMRLGNTPYEKYNNFKQLVQQSEESGNLKTYEDFEAMRQAIDNSMLTRSVYAPNAVSMGVLAGDLSRMAAEQIALGLVSGGTLTAENIVSTLGASVAGGAAEAIGATRLGQVLISKSPLAADLLSATAKGSGAGLTGAAKAIYTTGKIGSALAGELGSDAITGIVDDAIVRNSFDSQGNLDPDKFIENTWMNAVIMAATKGAGKTLSTIGDIANKVRNIDGVPITGSRLSELKVVDNAINKRNSTTISKVDSDGHPVVNVGGEEKTLKDITLSDETVKTMAEAGIVDQPTRNAYDAINDTTIPEDTKVKIAEGISDGDTVKIKEAIENSMDDAQIREAFPDGKLKVGDSIIDIDTKKFTAADVAKVDGSSIRNLDDAITRLENLKKGESLKDSMNAIIGLRKYASEFADTWKKAVEDYANSIQRTPSEVMLQLKTAAQDLRAGENHLLPDALVDLWNNNWKPVSNRLLDIEQKMTGARVNNIDFYSRDMVKGSFVPGEEGSFSIDTDANLTALGADANPFDITASSTAKNEGKLNPEQLELDPYTLAYEFVVSRAARMTESGEGKYFSAMKEAADMGEFDFSEADARKQLGSIEKVASDVDNSEPVKEIVAEVEKIPEVDTDIENAVSSVSETIEQTIEQVEQLDRGEALKEYFGADVKQVLYDAGPTGYKELLYDYLGGKTAVDKMLEDLRTIYDASDEVALNRDTLKEFGIKLKTSEYRDITGTQSLKDTPSHMKPFLSEKNGVSAQELIRRLEEAGVNTTDMTPGEAIEKLDELAQTGKQDAFYNYVIESLSQEDIQNFENAVLREAGLNVADDGTISRTTTVQKTEPVQTVPERLETVESKATQDLKKTIDKKADERIAQAESFKEKFEREASKSNAAELISNNSGYKNRGARAQAKTVAGVQYLPNNPFGTLSSWVNDRFVKANSIRIAGKGFDTTIYKGGFSLYAEAGSYARKVIIDVRNGANFGDAIYNVIKDNAFFVEPSEYAAKKFGALSADDQARIVANKIADNITKGKYSRDALDASGAVLDTELLGFELTTAFKNRGMSDFIRMLKKSDFDSFSKGEKKWLNQTMYMMASGSNKKFNNKLANGLKKAAGAIMKARYESNMWFNFKNAQLQLTEIQRLFTMNKLGDFTKTVARLATDSEFRSRVTDAAYIYASDSFGQGITKNDLNGRSLNDAIDAYLKMANSSTMTAKAIVTNLDDLVGKVDDVALGGIQGAEFAKNYILLAGIVQSADSSKLSGSQLDNYIRNRFNTEALAGTSVGKIGLTDSTLGQLLFMYQGFPIREFMLNYHTMIGGGIRGNVLGSLEYLTKWLGAKAAVWAVEAPWGYSLSSILGLDPFGLTDQDDRPSNETDPVMRALDTLVQYGPFTQGAVTSALADAYFTIRQAHEDAEEEWLETHDNLDGFEWSMSESAKQGIEDMVKGFVPGYTAFKRTSSEVESLDRGYAISSTGNRMYETDTDPLNIAMGFLAGRSNTRSGREYFQSSDPIGSISRSGLGGLGQALGRANPFRKFREFDPTDKTTYSDWFNGGYSDEQNWSTGIYDFVEEAQEISDAYNKKKGDPISNQAAKEAELADLRDRLEAYVQAYVDKHPEGISVRKMKDIQKVFKIDEATTENAFAQELTGYDYTPDEVARNRVAAGNFPTAYGYTGPTTYSPDAEIQQYNSPELYNLLQRGKYGVQSNVPRALQMADNAVIQTERGEMTLKEYRNQLNALKSAEYDKANPNYDRIEEIQREYLKAFDSVFRPILNTYGSDIIDNSYTSGRSSDVMQELNRMLSGWIPSDDYRVDKKGKKIYQSTPYMTVDIKKWLQKNYSGYSAASVEDKKSSVRLNDIRKDLNDGKASTAKAKARALINDLDSGRVSLTKDELTYIRDLLK